MTQSEKKIVVIHTDGACLGNPGPGGWAAILQWGTHEKILSGAERDTTNNQMELTAAIKALDALKRPMHVWLITDSQYVRKGITQWIERWKHNHWRTAAKKPVANQKLWQELDRLNQKHRIEWHWVKGHAGDEMNERCDKLARIEADGLRPAQNA